MDGNHFGWLPLFGIGRWIYHSDPQQLPANSHYHSLENGLGNKLTSLTPIPELIDTKIYIVDVTSWEEPRWLIWYIYQFWVSLVPVFLSIFQAKFCQFNVSGRGIISVVRDCRRLKTQEAATTGCCHLTVAQLEIHFNHISWPESHRNPLGTNMNLFFHRTPKVIWFWYS